MLISWSESQQTSDLILLWVSSHAWLPREETLDLDFQRENRPSFKYAFTPFGQMRLVALMV